MQKTLRSTAAPRLVDMTADGVTIIDLARPVPMALVLDVVGSEFDAIEAVLIDAVVDGRLDPRIARALLYATVEAEIGGAAC